MSCTDSTSRLSKKSCFLRPRFSNVASSVQVPANPAAGTPGTANRAAADLRKSLRLMLIHTSSRLKNRPIFLKLFCPERPSGREMERIKFGVAHVEDQPAERFLRNFR